MFRLSFSFGGWWGGVAEVGFSRRVLLCLGYYNTSVPEIQDVATAPVVHPFKYAVVGRKSINHNSIIKRVRKYAKEIISYHLTGFYVFRTLLITQNAYDLPFVLSR